LIDGLQLTYSSLPLIRFQRRPHDFRQSDVPPVRIPTLPGLLEMVVPRLQIETEIPASDTDKELATLTDAFAQRRHLQPPQGFAADQSYPNLNGCEMHDEIERPALPGGSRITRVSEVSACQLRPCPTMIPGRYLRNHRQRRSRLRKQRQTDVGVPLDSDRTRASLFHQPRSSTCPHGIGIVGGFRCRSRR